MHSIVVRICSNGTRNFKSLCVGLPRAEKIGIKDERQFVIIWWILAKPYVIPGLNSYIAE